MDCWAIESGEGDGRVRESPLLRSAPAGLKPPAVFPGRNPQHTPERVAHGVAVAKAAAGRYGFKAGIALLQAAPGRLQTQAFHEFRRGRIHLGAKDTCEVAWAHAHT